MFVAQGATGSVWMVGGMSSDSSALPNTGVRSSIEVISLQTDGSLAFWVSDDMLNNVWGQVGYFISEGGAPIAFYQIWNLNTSTILTEGSTPISVGVHAFSMYLQNGTNWAYAVDGNVFGSFSMGSSASSPSYPIYVMAEEQGNNTFYFPTVSFAPALQVMRAGSWTPVEAAYSYGGAWGVEGHLQNDSLQQNQLLVGGNLSALSPSSRLWSAPATASPASASLTMTYGTLTSAALSLPLLLRVRVQR